MTNRFLFTTLCFIVLALGKVQAQNTMLTEVSYPYLEKLIQLAKENYPKMKSFEKEIALKETNVKKAKASYLDVFNFAYMKSVNPAQTPHTQTYLLNGYQYGINLNFGSILQKPTNVKAAKQELEISYLERKEYNLLLENTVKERYYTYVKELTSLKLSMKAAQDSENMLKLITNKFEKGEERFESYNEALKTYSNLVQDRISAESTMLIAKANLEQIIGLKLEEVEYWQGDLLKK